MKIKKLSPVLRGGAAVLASVLVMSSMGYAIADTWRSQVDSALGTESYVTSTDGSAKYVSDYATAEDIIKAAEAMQEQQGEEGFVLMKNDNSALPLSTSNEVALFGLGAYNPYQGGSDLKAGNGDAVSLLQALKDSGITVNSTVEELYAKAMNMTEKEQVNAWTGQVTIVKGYDITINTTIGDLAVYKNNEHPVDVLADKAEMDDWKTSVKKGTVGIVVVSRPAGEGNTYLPGKITDYLGQTHDIDPLALSPAELSVIDTAKSVCDKVLVLVNSGNAMEIGELVSGEHEVDAIGYVGIPNDRHFVGIVNVLTGKANASGALAVTYVHDHDSNPVQQNFGGDYYSDYEIVNTTGEDPRWPGQNIANTLAGSFGGSTTYNGGTYIVEAEGIYVGYKYYESRYYDSIANPSYNATSTKGSTNGSAWNYDNEVVYTFGHGLSYLEYTQELVSVNVDKSREGYITATVAVTNNGDKAGKFTAQLYVQQPYTQYDITNKVEKSAVMFLNSAKVEVGAGKTVNVEIQVETKYLASYDYTAAKTYILDEGNYYFTAAAGAHEATNNILDAQGYSVNSTGGVKIWNNGSFDSKTYAIDNGYDVTNVADDADLNYWLPGTVTYLSRSNYETTYPKNYNTDVEIKIANSPKKDEWIKELRGQTYTIDNTDEEVAYVDGANNGTKFGSEYITEAQLQNFNDEYWTNLVNNVPVNEIVGAILHGGSRSDTLSNIENPVIIQNEGVNGYTAEYSLEENAPELVDKYGKTYSFNVNSQTLLASSFNPQLAWDWGVLEGDSGLWIDRYTLWGTGLTQIRSAYNGRNYEYISEDPMLTNKMGYGIMGGALVKGTLCGPKHMGFNDQEHNRGGISAYINEQKMRETDLRCFQGGMDDAGGLAVMIAFNRIGATNASHHQGMLINIVRNEWGFMGLISTDMMNNKWYFDGASMVMAGITQVADFAANNSFINKDNDHTAGDGNWSYITVDGIKNDAEFVARARQSIKYQLYAHANSAALNVKSVRVTPWWEAALQTTITVSAILTGLCTVAYVAIGLLPAKEEE